MQEKLKVTNDLLFQMIFGKVGNERITKGFLEKLLGIEIGELSLDTNKRLIGNYIDDKIGRIDVKAKLSDGTKVIIEMQVAPYKQIAERLLYYWAKTYSDGLKRGHRYEKLDKTIAILISSSNLEQTKEIDKCHTVWTIREEEFLETKLSDDLEIHIIELSKYKEEEQIPISNWIKFIKGDLDMVDIEKYEESIQEAIKELEYIEQDPEMQDLYESRENDIIDKIELLRDLKEEKQARKNDQERANQEMIKEKKLKENMIKSMYKNGISLGEICKTSNLTEQEVQAILNK